jgi:CRISPR-associated protein Csx16
METNPMSKPTCVVSFLGIGSYEPTIYEWRERSCQTKFIALALSEISEAETTYILVTEKARNMYGDELRAGFHAAGRYEPRFIDFPIGNSTQALWEQFRIVKDVLRENRDYHLIFDITLSFRTQPFFAAGVLSFVRSVDEDPYDIEVVYGAFEARNDNTTPVWDLTPFAELIQWSEVLSLFLKTGNAHLAAEPMEQRGRSIRKTIVQNEGRTFDLPKVDAFAKALSEFGDDIATVRTGNLLLGDKQGESSAAKLLQALSQSRDDFARYLPPVADVLDRVETFVKPLVIESNCLNTREGHGALLALAKLYQTWRRFPEAVITLREGWITLYAEDAAACRSRSNFDDKARRRAELQWGKCEGNAARTLADIRNDVEHGGYNKQPKPAKTIMAQVETWISKFRDVDAKTITHMNPADAIFLNLSNHPQAKWDDAQITAARDYAPNIEDYTFPTVDPEWDEKQVGQLADETVSKIPPNTTHALVVGEYSLTLALVSRLQQKGIVCLTATTARDVVEGEDGTKTSRFRFVRFRSYPTVA